MAIPDGHEDNAVRNARRQRRARQPNDGTLGKPGLFVRSLIPQSNVTTSIACHLISKKAQPQALSVAQSGSSSAVPSQLQGLHQNVPAGELVVATGSRLTLHTVDRTSHTLTQLCTLDLYSTIRDLSVVRSAAQQCDTLVVVLERSNLVFVEYDQMGCRLCVTGRVTIASRYGAAQQSRLIATHPDSSTCAVASLCSTITIFPVVFLRRGVSAGKTVSLDLDGVVLALDFLEVDKTSHEDSLLLVLVQRGADQCIDVFSITEHGGVIGNGAPIVKRIGSMMTGWEYLEDTVIARHAAKLGENPRTRLVAHGLCRIPGYPYLYAVFHQGRFVVGDAKHCLDEASELKQGSVPASIRVNSDARRSYNARWPQPISPSNVPGSPRLPSIPSSYSHSWEGRGYARDSGVYMSIAEPVHNAHGILSHHGSPTSSVPSMSSGDALSYPQSIRSNPASDPYLSFLISPVCVRLEVGHTEGAPTAWTSARSHMRSSGQYLYEDSLYVVMESGSMYALKWTSFERKGTYKIPCQDKVRQSHLPNFFVECMGHVGPTVSLSTLDENLLYVASDCADGSLRLVDPPPFNAHAPVPSNPYPTLSTNPIGYTLDVMQVFLNMAPISDLVVVPAGGVEKPVVPKVGRGYSRLRLRARECWASISSSSPRSQFRRGPRSSKSSFSPSSAFSDTDLCVSERRSPRSAPSSPISDMNSVSNSRVPEPELIVGCGVQKTGTIRIVKPGAPVTVFSSSSNTFGTCNDLWNVRISAELDIDTLIVASFVQSTQVLFSVPQNALPLSADQDNIALISQLLDATDACNLLNNIRTITAGRLEEGIVAQVHAGGVRTVEFLDSSQLQQPLQVENGQILCPLVRKTWDWTTQEGELVTTAATVGCGLVFLGLSRNKAQSPCLVVLRSNGGGLTEVARIELSAELSFICIPEWLNRQCNLLKNTSVCEWPVVILGTRTPSVEVLSLDRMLCSSISKMQPWFSVSPEAIMSESSVATASSEGSQMLGSFPTEKGRFGDHCILAEDCWPSFMKTWTPQKVLESSVMTCVPESIVSFECGEKRWVVVGLRNGSVLRYCLVRNPTNSDDYSLNLISRRRLGDVPIRLFHASLPSGMALIAQAERPWISLIGADEPVWLPLSFPETRAWCNYSTRGAERCLATVSSDDVLHICGIRRLAPVTVSSILVGDTPRRVLPLFSPIDAILVATGCEPYPSPEPSSIARRTSGRMCQNEYDMAGYSELKVYNKNTKRFLGGVKLLRGELVHVTLLLGEFVVVGTSIGMRSVKDFGPLGGCKQGRLLLYSVRSQTSMSLHKLSKSGSGRLKKGERVSFELCSEIQLPGAVLAGAVRPEHNILVVSCNSTIIMFGMLKNTLFEIARTAARMQVLSISLHGSTICAADRKDSVSFFRLDPESRSIVRDRTDHRKRLVADAEIVDNHTALVSDKLGGLFSVAYEEDSLEQQDSDDGDDSNWSHMFMSAAMICGLIDGGSSTFGDSINDDASDSLLNHDDRSDEAATDSQANCSDTFGESNDGTVQDTLLSAGTTANSTMNDDYLEDVEVEEVEGASIVETAGTTDVPNISDVDQDESIGEDIIDVQGMHENNNAMLIEGGNQAGAVGQIADSPGTPPMGILPNPLMITPPLRNDTKLIAKILVCDHAFNMRDTALRLRKAAFRRIETIQKDDSNDGKAGEFWKDKQNCVVAGTLGGALIAAVPISPGALALLDNIGYALFSSQSEENSFEQYRAAFGKNSTGVVDGDLVRQFLTLDAQDKQRVCEKAGYNGNGVVAQIEALIHELIDSAG